MTRHRIVTRKSRRRRHRVTSRCQFAPRVKYQSHLSLDELDLPPSAEWEPPLQCWCFVRVDNGQGYWLAASESREVNTGDILALPPARKGVFRASQLGSVRLFHFRFCPDLMSELLTMSERQHFDRLAGKPAPPVRLLPASHPIARDFFELCAHTGTVSGLLARCQMLELVGKFFARDLMPARSAETTTLSATKRIKVLLDHLTEEEFLNASSDELAAYCGCSPRHFSRLFLQHFGVSLRSRQTEMRLANQAPLIGSSGGLAFVATRDVARLHCRDYRPPAAGKISETEQYFLVECWRFADEPLRFDPAKHFLALAVRVSWPYRLPGSTSPTAATARTQVMFTVSLNR